jgi:single-stranded DNA-binding protein
MLTLTGNGRLTRDPQLRTTHSGKTVATISVASDRRDRTADAIYVDLIVWETQATAAAQHLVKGQRSASPAALSRARTSPRRATSASRSSCTASTSSTAPSRVAQSRRSRPATRRRARMTPTTFRSSGGTRAGRRAGGAPTAA